MPEIPLQPGACTVQGIAVRLPRVLELYKENRSLTYRAHLIKYVDTYLGAISLKDLDGTGPLLTVPYCRETDLIIYRSSPFFMH